MVPSCDQQVQKVNDKQVTTMHERREYGKIRSEARHNYTSAANMPHKSGHIFVNMHATDVFKQSTDS